MTAITRETAGGRVLARDRRPPLDKLPTKALRDRVLENRMLKLCAGWAILPPQRACRLGAASSSLLHEAPAVPRLPLAIVEQQHVRPVPGKPPLQAWQLEEQRICRAKGIVLKPRYGDHYTAGAYDGGNFMRLVKQLVVVGDQTVPGKLAQRDNERPVV